MNFVASTAEQRERYSQALANSLAGGFDAAKNEFELLEQEFLAKSNRLDAGRAQRDLARVHAGLGNRAGREAAIVDSAVNHRRVLKEAEASKDSSSANLAVARAERAATSHVAARIAVARFSETLDWAWMDFAAEEWRYAFDTVNGTGSAGADYRRQIEAHGSIALATFGRREDLGFALRLATDMSAIASPNIKRLAMMGSAAGIVAARACRISAPEQVKVKVIEHVAGPYIVRQASA